MPKPPVGSPARPRSDRWWCRCFAELVLVDELASAPAHSELRRRTLESGERSMIVSTWQIFPKRSFVAVSLGCAVKGVKLADALKVWQAKPRSIQNLLVPIRFKFRE